MTTNIKPGMAHTSEAVVTQQLSACLMGSGALDVLATPAMIALMENAAMNAIQHALPEGHGSVGTEISVAHTRATAIGKTVTATAEVIKIDGRRIDFKVTASDDYGEIGHGMHSRFAVENASFLNKLRK